MRWYIVKLADEGLPPWVIAEAVDEHWARDELLLCNERFVVLNDQELRLDPELRPALESWEAGDDRVHAAYEAVSDAEAVADEAYIEATIEEGLARARRRIEEGPAPFVFEDWIQQLPAAERRYYSSTRELWALLKEWERSDGAEAAAATARAVARDLVRYSQERGPRPI
jgi:hypothetical protein